MTGRARLYAVGAQGAVIAAATQIGDDIAQAVLMTRVGAVGWPVTLVAKAALDVLAAAAYLPLTRRRDPASVMRVLLAAYAAAVAAAWALGRTGRPGAYLVYVVHECAWTPLTIHWGVYLLAALDAREARRRLPVMFTAARVGAMIGGFVLARAVAYAAAIDLLWAAVALALIAASLPIGAVTHEVEGAPAPVTDERTGPAVRDPDTGWRAVWASPLVRAIAISTALMVVTRYGLRVVSLAAISDAKGGDENQVAGFLGDLGQIANLIGVLIGLFLVPLLVDRVGVTVLNLGYAAATLVAQLGLAAWPGLVIASMARFVDGPLKDAVKTPLSALFYGAEPPMARAPARTLVFGAVIPLATVITAGAFALVGGAGGVTALAILVAVAAGGFVIASALQNRAWRRRLRALLRTTLAAAPPGDPARAIAIAAQLAPLTAALPPPEAAAIASGLAA
ncbi:MAG: hypothetical protein K8W52_43050, partial [Deltaproteobacteria bacterium]|nr:hypothetical protein [Deltaproteobacteria bacterium]